MFSCLRKTCLSSGLPTNILPDLPVVCSWTVLLNKNSVLECVRVSVCAGCMCARTSVCYWLVWQHSESSDRLFFVSYLMSYFVWRVLANRNLWSGKHMPQSACLRVRVSLCILITALNQTALSWLMLVFGSRRERQFHWERINNAKGLGTVAVQTWALQLSHWSRCSLCSRGLRGAQAHREQRQSENAEKIRGCWIMCG